MSRFKSIIILSFFLLTTIISLTPAAYADAPPCDTDQTPTDKRIGIMTSLVLPDGTNVPMNTPLPEGLTNLSVKFDGGIVNGNKYRLRFGDGLGQIYTDYFTASSGLVVPITNSSNPDISKELQKGTHTSTLEYLVPGSSNPQERCGYITYSIGQNYNFSDCQLTYIPSPTVTENDDIEIIINKSPQGNYPLQAGTRELGTISVDSSGTGRFTIPKGTLKLGSYDLNLYNGSRAVPTFCHKDLNIQAAGSTTPSGSCAVLPATKLGEPIKIRGINLQKNTTYQAFLDDNPVASWDTKEQTTVELELGKDIPAGNHTAYLKDSEDHQICSPQNFNVGSSGLVTVPPPPSLPAGCKAGATDCSSGGGTPCTPTGGSSDSGIKTAIGCIPTEPVPLIRALIAFVIAISGGMAFLLMVIGAFGMITSAGNPDSLNASRDRFVKAIEGLLFIIFATLLMKIIGVDILGLGAFLGF